MAAAVSHVFSIVACLLMLAAIPVRAAVVTDSLMYDNGLVSLSAEALDVQTILGQLAEAAGVQVVVTGRLPSGSRRVNWKRVPIQNAFEEVLRGTNFALVYPGIPGTDEHVHMFGKASGPAGRTGRSGTRHPAAKTEKKFRRGPAAYSQNTSLAGKSGDPSSFAVQRTVTSHTQKRPGGTTGAQNPMASSGSPSNNLQSSLNSDTNTQSGSGAENTALSSSDTALTGTALEKSRLKYQIEQIQSSIDSGEADKTYQFWQNTGKSDAYIYNPWNELARLQNRLKAME